ncbi:competence protein CoiA [Mucilaginibacter paludis]|uniref:Competence CoiA family protein n=1 Tax=Mucilaginibacter paludis DSM 18603 TaxID=714943 RepID=H1Y3F0_9SPHI|nr:competence protein CoiA family protein [Mucilaginibacter paludis]EHQ29718.1 Competence CoiA family protein [Mucilaginibacter paludis DSM 18603]
MEYALVNGVRVSASAGLQGSCPACGNAVIARCGKVKVHHWAHQHLPDCDIWSEPETPWHRAWKARFPEAWQEVPFTDPETGEIHRADVHTPGGVTLEFQHSPISVTELGSRNAFYKKLVWIVDAQRFQKNFEWRCHIPDPRSPLLDNFSIIGTGRYSMNVPENLMFFRNPAHDKDWDADRVLSFRDPELAEVKALMQRSGDLFRLFDWKWQNEAWLNSEAPVFLDFGTDQLYWLRSRKQHRHPGILYYLQVVSRQSFIEKYGGK